MRAIQCGQPSQASWLFHGHPFRCKDMLLACKRCSGIIPNCHSLLTVTQGSRALQPCLERMLPYPDIGLALKAISKLVGKALRHLQASTAHMCLIYPNLVCLI